jgi:zinc transport system substrate-binding protein
VLAAALTAAARAADRREVIAAFYPLAEAAERVGGASVEVRNLTPAGAEPHDVELSARTVADIRGADLVLYLGGGFQPALERALEGSGVRRIDLLAGLARGQDPHVWLDPTRYATIVRRVGRALAAPGRAAAFARQLAELDRAFRRGLADCKRREIVTSHAAFGYLAARYGLRQIAVSGLSPGVEPSPRDLEDVVRRVRASRATTVFFEPLVSPGVAETVARETGARTAVLDPLEGLTEERLARGDDYVTVMRRNLAALRRALSCRQP